MACSTFGSVRFLFMAPLILVFLFVINVMTSPGEWWVQWAALGLGIAWVINLMKVLRTLVVVGGLAGLATYIAGRRRW
ncbi:MAG TPA: 2TM domain-containing protein [Vicinamibacterales bacterium]